MSARHVRAEAAAWLARLHADDATDADRAACTAWLAEAPAHRAAMAEANAMWDATGGLAGQWRKPDATGAPPWRRRGVLALSGAAAATMVLGGVGLSLLPRQAYATGIGEQKQVRLPDGSMLFLDACSRVTCAFSRRLREVVLHRGRIALTVAPDPGRPFLITGRHVRLFPLGRTVQVAELDGAVSVTALDGAVVTDVPGAGTLTLTGGERLTQAGGAAPVTDRPALATVTAWQSGRLDFANERLAQAIAEMNRYTHRRLVLGAPDLGRLRISGSYRAHATADFAHAVALLFGLHVNETPTHLTLRRQ